MRIIPVLDLKGGVVVHAVAGCRDRYQPVVSTLCRTARPLEVAKGLRERLASRELYVADLDGIQGGEPDWAALKSLSDEGFHLLLDAGARAIIEIDRANGLNVSLIVASEWMQSPQELDQAIDSLGSDRVIFGLDLDEGNPIVRAADWQTLAPLEITERVKSLGVSVVVLLDTSSVGTGTGPSPKVTTICREIASRFPEIELISGGGVRSTEDLQIFESSGCTGALVATALHNGRLTNQARGTGVRAVN